MFSFNLDENCIASEQIISVYLDLIPVDFLYVGSKNKICSVRKFQFNLIIIIVIIIIIIIIIIIDIYKAQYPLIAQSALQYNNMVKL